MKVTNDLSLPEPLVVAVQSDGYEKGECDFSTTELISPPRIAVLKRQWEPHLTEDVSDRIFALIGKSVHSILEHSAQNKRYIVEKRFFHVHDGYRIGGQIDIFDRKESALQDWKVTSYFTTGDARFAYPWSTLRTAPTGRGWIEQGNINRYLMFRNGFNVKLLQYVAIYRDWSKMQTMRSSQYPPRQVEILRIPLWTYAETEDYLSERIRLHVAARTELPLCTPEERWEDTPMFAVVKQGGKRASWLFEHEAEAQEQASLKTAGKVIYGVEPRPSEPKRCLYYCPVAGHCTYGRKVLQEKEAAA